MIIKFNNILLLIIEIILYFFYIHLYTYIRINPARTILNILCCSDIIKYLLDARDLIA